MYTEFMPVYRRCVTSGVKQKRTHPVKSDIILNVLSMTGDLVFTREETEVDTSEKNRGAQ